MAERSTLTAYRQASGEDISDDKEAASGSSVRRPVEGDCAICFDSLVANAEVTYKGLAG